MRVHSDERRTAYCDLFDTPGDVNLFIVNPGQRTAWHRHQKQTDQFRVLRGTIRFGVTGGPYPAPIYETLDGPERAICVMPLIWHGYENIGTGPAHLLMYLDRKYDPSDEERMSEAEMPWAP